MSRIYPDGKIILKQQLELVKDDLPYLSLPGSEGFVSLLQMQMHCKHPRHYKEHITLHLFSCSHSVSCWRSTEPWVLGLASCECPGFTVLVKNRLSKWWGRTSMSNANFWSSDLSHAMLDSKVLGSTKCLHVYCLKYTCLLLFNEKYWLILDLPNIMS